MLQVRFRPEADREFQQAIRWYYERQPGLEVEFKADVEEAIKRIQRNPNLYPITFRHLRRAIVRRFPFSIYYSVAKGPDKSLFYLPFQQKSRNLAHAQTVILNP